MNKPREHARTFGRRSRRVDPDRSGSERGAALVEMAVILPLVVLLLFGMIEASWAFATANDVRHGAREGARLAAVDYGDVATIGAEVCSRMDIKGSGATVTLADASGGTDNGARGSEGRITVAITYASLTGSLDQWFGGKTITSQIDFIIEQPIAPSALWWVSDSGSSHICI